MPKIHRHNVHSFSRDRARAVKAAIAVARARVSDPEPSQTHGYVVNVYGPWPSRRVVNTLMDINKTVITMKAHEEMLTIAMADMNYTPDRAANILAQFRSRGGSWYAYLGSGA